MATDPIAPSIQIRPTTKIISNVDIGGCSSPWPEKWISLG
jgi:hypothetical protein